VNLLARSTGNHKRSPSYCATNWIEGSSIMWAAKYRAVPPDMHVLTTRAASIVIKNPWVEGFAAVVLWAETLIVTSASQSSVHRLSLGAPAGSLHECERREILMALGYASLRTEPGLGSSTFLLSRIAPLLTGGSAPLPSVHRCLGGRSANRHPALDWKNGQFPFEHLEHSPRFREAYIPRSECRPHPHCRMACDLGLSHSAVAVGPW
jgi:hypothetical protein